MGGDAMFAAAIELAKAFRKLRQDAKEARRKAKNERRRRMYAIRKETGTLPKRKVKVEPEPEPEPRRWREPEGCTCFLGHPPCSWCTREVDEEDEDGN